MASSTGFVHVLATRMGIGVYDDVWFDYRLALFEAITLPSIAAQTSQDFTWLLVIDQNMPAIARKRLELATAPFPNMVLIPVEFKTDFRGAVIRWSQEKAAAVGVSNIMTSRLDDDDALRVDAFERLQSEAETFQKVSRHRYAVFSLSLGCMWVPSHRRGYTRYHDSHTLGLSLMEPVEGCRTVYSRPHREIKHRFAPVGAYIRGIDGDTLWWLYATHNLADSDTGNRTRVERVLSHKNGYPVDDLLLQSFGLQPDAVDGLAAIAEPESARPTKFLSLRGLDAERQIKDLRQRLWTTPRHRVLRRYLTRARLWRLQRLRRSVGSSIVRDKRSKRG